MKTLPDVLPKEFLIKPSAAFSLPVRSSTVGMPAPKVQEIDFAFPKPPESNVEWAVSKEEKKKFDDLFAQIDTKKINYLSGIVAG